LAALSLSLSQIQPNQAQPGCAAKVNAMIISDSKTIRDIQAEFHRTFPGLKIEFYKQAHESGQGSPVKERIDADLKLKFVREVHNKEDFEIDPSMTVASFEQLMADRFGLNVQVFRKSGNLWMQTTSTDHWALREQNRKGSSSESHYNEKHNV
jgi:hypothetical protein